MLRVASLKRLRSLVEPVLSETKNKNGLTLAEIEEPARQALAVYLLTGILDSRTGIASLLKSGVPEYIQHFDEGYLIGERYEKSGKKMFKLLLEFSDKRMTNGKRPTIGVFDAEERRR